MKASCSVDLRAELQRVLQDPDVIDLLADVEYAQWQTWARDMLQDDPKAIADMRRRARLLLVKPYDRLSEKEKEVSRKWANLVIKQLLRIFA